MNMEAADNNPILNIKDLSMQFGGIKALSDISFSINKGAILALIGPNGAGKTTVFNCCTGFYTPSSGDIYFQSNKGSCTIGDIIGKPIYLKDFVAPHKVIYNFYRKMFGGTHQICQRGMVRTFQNVRVFKEMTVIENLLVAQHKDMNWNLVSGFFNTKSYTNAKNKCLEKSYFWLEELNLLDDAHTLAGALSYGKTRKLELARSMCTSPIIICLDEPAAGLNSNETEELSSVIKKLRDVFKVTVFLIEHDMRMVMDISDNIVVLDHGQIIARGTPKEIQNNPKVIEAYLGVSDDE